MPSSYVHSTETRLSEIAKIDIICNKLVMIWRSNVHLPQLNTLEQDLWGPSFALPQRSSYGVQYGSFDFKENATLRAFAGFITLAIQSWSPVKK